jgi:glutamate-ammonia-ligase adenylyltransferase
MIYLYEGCEDGATDGARSLPNEEFFARLGQRLIHLLTARTPSGLLYEVDMRLRPSGKSGTLVTSLVTFQEYQRTQAWTWEHQALVRARAVAGAASVRAVFAEIRKEILCLPRDADKLRGDVADMRQRMETEHHTDSIWDIKHMRGGLVDIEFMAQYLQLLHAHEHRDILSTGTMKALENIRSAELLDRAVVGDLIDGLLLWQRVQERLRLTLSEAIEAIGIGADDAPKALREALQDIGGLDFETLVTKIRETSYRVHAHFITIVEEPADILRVGNRGRA